MKRLIIPILFSAVFALNCTVATPSFVDRFESDAPPPSSPADAPEDWLLAFVDIETTGLVPGWHEPIDVGVVITDLEGTEIDHWFGRMMPQHPERISPGAKAVNAFDADEWRSSGALHPDVAVREIIAFHEQVAGERPVMMVAFNSQFDAAFLDHLFRSAGRSWREIHHYFVLDIPSMAWSQGHRQLTGAALATALGIADEPRVAEEHTGLTGAKLNVRIYQALQRNGRE